MVKSPLMLLMLLPLFSLVACGVTELSSEQDAFYDYLNEMHGVASTEIRSGSLRDQGEQLLIRFNDVLQDWQDDRLQNSEFASVLDDLIDEVDVHVDELGDVGATGELRSIHNKYVNGWREWETGTTDLRLFLLDPTNSSLLSAYTKGISSGEALFGDYVVSLHIYLGEIEK